MARAAFPRARRGSSPTPPEPHIQQLLEAALDPCFILAPKLDRSGRIVDLVYRYVNAAGLGLYGMPADRVVGHRLLELFPSVRELGVLARYVSVLDTGEPARFEVPNFNERGVVASFEISAALLGDDLIVTARDTTEWKHAQNRFQTVVEAMIDPLCILTAEREREAIVDFRFDYANPAGGNLVGVPAEKLLGRGLLEIAPASTEWIDLFRHVVETGEPVVREVDYHGPLGDGAQAELDLAMSVVRLGDGVVVSGQNLAPIRQAEAALHRSGERFRSLIQNSTDILLVVDREGLLTYISPALTRAFGYDVDRRLGTPAIDLVHPEDRDLALSALTEGLSAPGASPPRRYRIVDALGDTHWIESVGNNLLDDPAVRGLVINARDVTIQVESELALADANRVLRTVTAADAAVVHATSEPALLEEMCRVIVETGGYALAWIAEPDPTLPGCVVAIASYGTAPRFQQRVMAASRGPVVHGPATEAVAIGQTRVIHDLTTLERGLPLREISLEYGYRSEVALPLLIAGEVIGALAIHSTTVVSFDEAEVALLERLASDLAYGVRSIRTRVERQHYADRLERNLGALVETAAATVEARDPYTAGHQRGVAELAAAIATELGLDASEVAGIRMAGNLHDIGKIGVPTEILSRTRALLEPEYELIKLHAQVGYDLVKGIEFPWPVADIILQHHERLDGSGYPQALHGEEILRGARIVAVADVVEAMASHRPYRPSKGIAAALAQIESERGVRLDADAVDACLALFREGRFTLDEVGDPAP